MQNIKDIPSNTQCFMLEMFICIISLEFCDVDYQDNLLIAQMSGLSWPSPLYFALNSPC